VVTSLSLEEPLNFSPPAELDWVIAREPHGLGYRSRVWIVGIVNLVYAAGLQLLVTLTTILQILLMFGVVLILLLPFLAYTERLHWRRVYLADKAALDATGDPESAKSALLKISQYAPDPVQYEKSRPPTSERIAALEVANEV
jgi:Zn-dependent protease with chaperone function